MNIVLFGPPGAGKGTQSAKLVEALNLKHISTGDLFRAAIKSGTPLGQKAKLYIDAGNLVPDEVTIHMVKEAFLQLKGQGFILDGFPRNVTQAEALNTLLGSINMTLDKVVFLEVPQAELIGRLSGRRTCRSCGAVYHIKTRPVKNGKTCDACGSNDLYQREDDKEESVRNRLVVYDESTKPLKNYYKNLGLLLEVDGTGAVEKVCEQIMKVIG
jgi:adenylate kinase